MFTADQFITDRIRSRPRS